MSLKPKTALSKGQGHPLFDPPDPSTPDTRDISWIHVSRAGYTFPTLFSAQELTTLDDIATRWGGGHYELTGRNEDRSRISAKTSHRLPGKSKPFLSEDEAAAEAPRAPTVTMSPTDNPWFQLIATIVLPAGLAYLKESASERSAREAREAEQRREEQRRADEQRREDQRRAEEDRRRADERHQASMLAMTQANQATAASTMQAFSNLTTTLVQTHATQSAGAPDASSLLNMFKAGGEHALSLAKNASTENGGDKSIEALLQGAGMMFHSQAEQAGAKKAEAELARTQLEAGLRGAPVGHPYFPGMPMHPPPGMPPHIQPPPFIQQQQPPPGPPQGGPA